ncbi:unnamed protein product [Adineta ricciae]|nr:unnamed protein product [Adineta ricciae]
MLNHCRHRYRDNKRMLEQIDQFQKEYTVNDAINWYTRPTFIFDVVNTALRTNAMEDMYSFRWYIIDLSHCLRQQWEKQRSQFVSPLHLYRGITMTKVMFDKLRSYDVGTLISESSFLSTSYHNDISEMFAGSGTLSSNTDLVSVLFHITVMDAQNPYGPIFIDTAFYAVNPDESEILFDMCTLFRIMDISYDESKQTWNVKLIAVPKNEPNFNIQKNFRLSDHEQKKLYETFQKQMMGWRMFLMKDASGSLVNKVFSDFDSDGDEGKFQRNMITSFFGKTIKSLTASQTRTEVATATVVTLDMTKTFTHNNLTVHQPIHRRFIQCFSRNCSSLLHNVFPLTFDQLGKKFRHFP